MRIVLVTGLSGSGKSVAIRLLEDVGYYCVDNLPPQFLLELCAYLANTDHKDVAVAVDARSESSLVEVPNMVVTLRRFGHDVRVLFLTASDTALVQRFSETRRRHPVSWRTGAHGSETTVGEAIAMERELLAPLNEIAHVIDTSGLRPNMLRHWVREFVDSPRANLTLSFESFAFKDGIPIAADLVFDVRNLPNPYYDPVLRPLTGCDPPVAAFLASAPAVREMIDDIGGFIGKWLPSYVADNRNYVTVAIGCTGGRHRSVYIVEELASRFADREHVLVRHRSTDLSERR
jgi:RNase adapter protein RapZ